MSVADYSFGNWVKHRRKALDLTQLELAQRVGCSLATIVKIESDERRPSRQDASAECGNTKQQGSQKIHGVGYLPKHWEDTQVNLAGDARKHPKEAQGSRNNVDIDPCSRGNGFRNVSGMEHPNDDEA